MTNIVNLPTYEQSEQIKQGVENVETAINDVETAVENIQTIVEGSGGTDWSKYIPFVNYGNINIGDSTDTSYKTIYSIEGEGYLSGFYINGDAASKPILRVTIDETLIYEFSAFDTSGISGFVLESAIKINTSGVMSVRTPTANGNSLSPINSKTNSLLPQAVNDGIVVAHNPLFFNKSLLLEAKKSTASSVYTLRTFASGGVAL